MFSKSLPWLFFSLFAFFPGLARADFEDMLLQRFQKQNQTTASQLKEEAKRTLAEAESQGRQDAPVKLLERLRQTLGRLEDDVHLDKAERASLIHQFKVRLREVQEVVAEQKRKEAQALVLLEKEKLEKERIARAERPRDDYSPPLRPFQLERKSPRVKQFAVVPVNVGFQTTPVVSAGRRWVRIGFTGSFTMFRPGPLVPVTFVVPTVLLGPGAGITIGPPFRILQIAFPL